MSFSSSNQGNGRIFNNADSFAMEFDEGWKTLIKDHTNLDLSKEEKVNLVLARIKDHPFLMSSPKQAREIIDFRIRLLSLN